MSIALPDISIVVPHLNQPGHLEKCLRSLAAQVFDLSRVEIIVVDNGSKHLPTDICAAFANVRLVQEPTPGPGPARNTGIGVSSAPLLAFIDADCIAGDGWLSAIEAAFADTSTEVIGGDVRIALESPDRMTMLEAYESIYSYRQRQYIEKQGFSGTGNLAMRRRVYERVGPFAGIGVAEDREWGQRATTLGYRIRYVPAMVAYHPARKTFRELRVKWDRHIAHDFEEQPLGWLGRSRWLAKALLLAASPVWELIRIARSTRISTIGDRFSALRVLTIIRLHRSRSMILLLLRRPGTSGSTSWNRTGQL